MREDPEYARPDAALLFNQIPIGTPAESFDQEVDKRPSLDRQVPRLWIDRVDRNLGRPVFGENGSQASLLKVRADDERREKRDAASSHCGIPQDLGVVGAQRPRDLNPMLAFGSRKLPLIAGREVAVGQAGVIA
jgi:hypothetical protein